MIESIGSELPQRREPTELLLPTRAAALRRTRTALLTREGPILISGEAGVGKSWLARRLEAECPYPWRWARVDLTPATDPGVLFHAIGRALGLADAAGLDGRWGYVDALAESAAEGERWVLVAEEAHNATDGVWEEIRVLANHLGEPGGFAGIVLVGQTPLVRRLRTRSLAALEARLACQVHLQPFDRDEAACFLEQAAPGRSGAERMADVLHRDLAGNPRRLAQAAAGFGVRLVTGPADERPLPRPAPTPVPVPAAGRPIEIEAVRPTAIPVPTKPPLHEEDGLIEVGWEPSDLEPDEEPADEPSPPRGAADAATATTEEPIDDHYAALQAWSEWATNQGRAPAAAAATLARSEEPEPREPADDRTHAGGHASVWAEGQHAFAPYSQLFSRMRQARDSQ